MDIVRTCAPSAEPSNQTLMAMAVAAAVCAATTVYLVVMWARKSARQAFKKVCKGTFDEVDHDKSGLVDADELYAAVLLVYLQVNKAIRVVGAVKPPSRASVDGVLEKYVKDEGKGANGLTDEQFEDVMLLLSRDAVGRVTITIGLTLGCPMAAAIIIDYLTRFFRYNKAWERLGFGPCGNMLYPLIEPQLPTIVSLVLIFIALPLGLDAVDAYLEGRESKLGAVAKSLETAVPVSLGERQDSLPLTPANTPAVHVAAPDLSAAAEALTEAKDDVAEKVSEVVASAPEALKKKSSSMSSMLKSPFGKKKSPSKMDSL